MYLLYYLYSVDRILSLKGHINLIIGRFRTFCDILKMSLIENFLEVKEVQMVNERLKNAMAITHTDVDAIVKVTNVDPKTVQRWINGRVPHARYRSKIAKLLREREDFLWSDDGRSATSTAAQTSEIVDAYTHRADVPANLWWELFARSQKQIDLLGYAMLFLPEQHSNLIQLLKEKAKTSCKIRIAIADPTSEYVQKRDEEEQLGGTLSARIQMTLFHFRDLQDCANIQIRYHTTPMYNSVFRFDNSMFVTPHLYSVHGSKAPLFHLRRLGSYGIFENFATHFETIWTTTKPVQQIPDGSITIIEV